ncbi:MAG: sugar ABC transporter substrate-binding protein [Clostridia bacterium]|nr:sugar ABC transporter substrate-binding protein [Clostridia bacterium]
MKKHLAKIAAVALTGAVVVGTTLGLTACSGGNGLPNIGDDETAKIGVLVSDVNGDEAKAFRAYYENYLEKQYNVDFTYTEALENAAGERAAIETFAAQGYHAIISLSASDRAMQIETCEANNLYYAVASGMLDDAQYEKYKGYECFVGQIGPDMTTEYEAGKAMGEYYKTTKNVSKVAIYGAFIPNPMHVYRAAGILAGLGLTYGGQSAMDAVVGQIFGDQGLTVSKISGPVTVSAYVQGFNPDVTFGEIGGAVATQPDAFLSVGMATTFFSSVFAGANVQYADIDSFTEGNVAQMSQEGGKLTYLAGKYASSIGPVFAAVYNAVHGNVIKDNGNAISIGQNYGVATTAEAAAKYQTADSGNNPIINKSLLDTVIGKDVTFDTFKAFVETDRTPA